MYDFRPLHADDLPLLKHWLSEPHVAEWWGDPGEQFDLVSGDLSEPAMDQFIVGTGGIPFAYLQCYRLTDWNIDLGDQPEATRGIDVFIGERQMLGHGHGSAFIRAFSEGLIAYGTPRVITDPDPANRRAVRAYEKAGFIEDRLVNTPDGISLLMVRNV